jgi:hypothetical protein
MEGGAFAMELSGVVGMSASPSGRYLLLFKDEGKEVMISIRLSVYTEYSTFSMRDP